ncbi:MAG: DUF898 family protein, partial [Gammaproteobacteria bacterium]
MAEALGAVDPELQAFLDLFEIRVPPGVTQSGLRRFMDAYLRDPVRRARWDARLSPVPPPSLPASARAPRAVAPVPPHRAPLATTPAAYVATRPERLQFSGSGGEYFRIWIVNLLLSVLTLGIYSAWAKVRRMQYFYRNTTLAGAR